MSAFPGSIRRKELQKRSFDVPPRFLEPSPPPLDKKARMQPVVNPYFKPQSNSEIVSVKVAQKATDTPAKIDRITQSSTPRLDFRNGPVSPPLLKRNVDLMTSESSVTDVRPSFELPDLHVRSPKSLAFQLTARDARAVTDTDLLYAMNPKPRRGPSDDNSSIFSGETRLSGSTSSRTKENTCRECKFKGHANLPLIKCSTCTNRFHGNEKCINPMFCDVKDKEIFRCRQCVSKGRTRVMASLSLPPAEDVSTLPSASHDLTPSFDAITTFPSLFHIPELDGHIETKKDSQAQKSHQKGQDDPELDVTPAPVSHLVHDLIVSKTRSVGMSIVPREPAAMRETSSPILHRLPRTHNLMDSYRPDLSSPPIATRGREVYRPSEHSQPPPVHLRKEREKFLRNASEDERDHYLRQNRKEICKDIICPQWGLKGRCGKKDKCLYGHEETGSCFPSKGWTCGAWLMGRSGCRDSEEDCVFAHYDTGVYADIQGVPSMKHVTCFWWSRDDLTCRRGARCKFAHYDTGIAAEDPGSYRRERSPPSRRPSSPVRRTSDSWRPEASMTKAALSFIESSPPPVRDTPLSPVVPSESESDEYEPSSIQNLTQRDHGTESGATSAQLQPQAVTELLPAAKVEAAAHGSGLLGGFPQTTVAGSASLEHSKVLRLDVGPIKEALPALVIPVTVPRQYARRTGGLKLHRTTDPRRRKQATTIAEASQDIPDKITDHTQDEGQDVPTQPVLISDPRLRKPALSSVEPSQNTNCDETGPITDGIQGISAQTHSDLHPVENAPVLKCQTCTRLVLISQATKHKCQRMVSIQVSGPHQPPNSEAFSKGSGMADSSNHPHTMDQNPFVNDQVDQVNEPDVTIALDSMGHVFSRNLPVSNAPELAIHGPKRILSGSRVDDLFLPNKKRKLGPLRLSRASTSAISPITGQAPVPLSAKMKKAPAVSLSIEDLTELTALRKEFDYNEEWQSDDDVTTLKFLQAKKKKKVDWEERLAREEEAEEAAYRARLLEEKEKRRKKYEADLAAEEVEELAQAERDRSVRQRLREQGVQESRRPNGDVEITDASHGSTSPNTSRQGSMSNSAHLSLRDTTFTTPGHGFPGQIYDEDPAATEELEKRFNGVFSVISPNLAANIARASGPLPTSRLQQSTVEQSSTPKDRSGLVSASPDGEDNEYDETNTDSAKASSQLGRRHTACEPCRRKRIKCHHHGTPLSSVGNQQLTAHDMPINVDPHELGFRRPFSNEITGKLTLSNPNAIPVAFRVKTTAPKQYCVQPNFGTISPGGEMMVQILLQAMKEDPPPDAKCRDKFLIQSVAILPRDDPSSTDSVWPDVEKTNKSAICERKIRVNFLPEYGATSGVNSTCIDYVETSPAYSTRTRGCVPCQKTKRKCHHNPNTGVYDLVQEELRPTKRQRVTSDSSRSVSAPMKSMTPEISAPEPMFTSILAGISAAKIATTAFAQAPMAIVTDLITAYPAANLSGDSTTAEREADKSLTHHPLRSTDLNTDYQENGTPRSCANCGKMPSRRLRRFGRRGQLLCDSCYMYKYRSKTKEDRPLNDQMDRADRAAPDTFALRPPSISVAARQEGASALASDAIAKASESALSSAAHTPSSIAPAEILALFCQSLPSLVETNEAVPWSVHEHHGAGPRLVQSRMLSEQEHAAAVVRMRAQGIEVISVDSSDSDSDSSRSGSEASEYVYPFRPVPLIKSARYKEEPDPRRWIDEVEDQKAKTFDEEAARRRINARPGPKDNVKALQNYTKPGKLLTISDWRSRIRNYGSFHRETERDPGPQKMGTYVREVADRTKLTIPRGFDDPEVVREEVQGTMQEFLSLPRQMKYDLTDSNRLVGARTLAFSDAAGRGRVPDREKFPVGKGG